MYEHSRVYKNEEISSGYAKPNGTYTYVVLWSVSIKQYTQRKIKIYIMLHSRKQKQKEAPS